MFSWLSCKSFLLSFFFFSSCVHPIRIFFVCEAVSLSQSLKHQICCYHSHQIGHSSETCTFPWHTDLPCWLTIAAALRESNLALGTSQWLTKICFTHCQNLNFRANLYYLGNPSAHGAICACYLFNMGYHGSDREWAQDVVQVCPGVARLSVGMFLSYLGCSSGRVYKASSVALQNLDCLICRTYNNEIESLQPTN